MTSHSALDGLSFKLQIEARSAANRLAFDAKRISWRTASESRGSRRDLNRLSRQNLDDCGRDFHSRNGNPLQRFGCGQFRECPGRDRRVVEYEVCQMGQTSQRAQTCCGDPFAARQVDDGERIDAGKDGQPIIRDPRIAGEELDVSCALTQSSKPDSRDGRSRHVD